MMAKREPLGRERASSTRDFGPAFGTFTVIHDSSPISMRQKSTRDICPGPILRGVVCLRSAATAASSAWRVTVEPDLPTFTSVNPAPSRTSGAASLRFGS